MRPGQTAPECACADGVSAKAGRCFNEAGADCPGMLDINPMIAQMQRFASMRPGQTAPECYVTSLHGWCILPCFDEAGADCPGMPLERHRLMHFKNRFNEAGADCPGMRRSALAVYDH